MKREEVREISALRRMKRSICESQGAEFDSVDHRRAKKAARQRRKAILLVGEEEINAYQKQIDLLKKEKADEAQRIQAR
jgi:hypothetical protein